MGLMPVTHNILILRLIKFFYRAILTPFLSAQGLPRIGLATRDCSLEFNREAPSIRYSRIPSARGGRQRFRGVTRFPQNGAA